MLLFEPLCSPSNTTLLFHLWTAHISGSRDHSWRARLSLCRLASTTRS